MDLQDNPREYAPAQESQYAELRESQYGPRESQYGPRESQYGRGSQYGSQRRSFFGSRESRTAHFSNEPQQIALLLPLSGKHADAAKAIKEGFLASYYENTHSNRYRPMVRIYDTTKEPNIQFVYDRATHDGADFVVGPLSKEDVQRLSTLSYSRMRTPILALNHASGSRTTSGFVQFSLAPEEEAEQIADKAWEKGYHSASIIIPDSAWGKRVASAFNAQWQKNGGRTLHTVYINPSQDQAAAVRRLLGIDESQKRANDIKSLLTEKIEFQPKRRQDVDVIVMAAPPDQARQLKPLFDFYYAEDLPVYATSSIYSGYPDPKRDRDMNGVIFCDMPWLINQSRGREVQLLLSKNASTRSDQYNRLFAMGVDAYHLISQLKRLEASNSHYAGATGNLTLGDNNQIQRKLAWAKISNGVPIPISQ